MPDDALTLPQQRRVVATADGGVKIFTGSAPVMTLSGSELSAIDAWLRGTRDDVTARIADVTQFQRKMDHAYDGPPRLPEHGLRMFRLRFLGEELTELGDALGVKVSITYEPVVPSAALELNLRERLARALDALIDLDYVSIGTTLQLGLGAAYPEAWRRVHAANLAKEPGVKVSRGFARDVVKPPGWRAPNLEDLVDP